MSAGEDISARVAGVLVEALNVDEDDIRPTATLQGDLGAESIDFLDIVFRLEREFGITIPRGELFPESVFRGGPDLVHDGRVTGSITLGQSRLPVWALMADLCGRGWPAVERNWPQVLEYRWTADRFAAFLCDLTESRGEFARLLLALAAVQRREQAKEYYHPRWVNNRDRKALREQLQRCLAALGA